MSMIYREIVEKTAAALQEAGCEIPDLESVIKKAVEAVASEHAVHVWGVDDVFFSAENSGYPISHAAACEILGEVEDHVDSEYGTSWETIRTSIEIWFGETDFETWPDEKLADLKGPFVLHWQTPKRQLPQRQLPRFERMSGKTALEAVRRARRICRDKGVEVTIFSANMADEHVTRYGHEFLTVWPDDE